MLFLLIMCGILSAISVFLSVNEMSLFVKICGVLFLVSGRCFKLSE
ncbi:unnamed protein product [Brassica rapa]|uniref:Uncharacterized protein n=1 Tax=Brassica campestris TaxID=3711 RepID=A0A8D9GXV3_BRACM|nr:unnamed protein product [Brassica rapa]